MALSPASHAGSTDRPPRAARLARLLTLSGALPFVGLALLVPFGPPLAERLGLPALAQQIDWWAATLLVLYAAGILSFLGGIRFGAVVAEPLAPGARGAVALSVVPSLVGWVLAAVGMGGQFSGFTIVTAGALALFALGFLAQWGWDRQTVRAGRLPPWFGAMRSRITLIVVPTLLAAAVLVAL